MRHLVAVGLVLAIVAPLSAQTVVEHKAFGLDYQFEGEADQPSVAYTVGWDSWNGRSKPPLKSWNTSSEGVAAAEFDKAELQAAIDDTIAMYGTWQAEILVTQVNWVATPIVANYVPVVGSADVGSSTGYIAFQGDGANGHPLQRVYDHDGDPNTPDQLYDWLGDARQNGSHRESGPGSSGQWTDWSGTAQGMFAAAVLAGVGGGQSMVSVGPAWTQSSTETANFAWTALIEATDVVAHYVDSDALLLFASGETSAGPQVFGSNQWGGAADIRVKITPEPVSLALLAMGGLVALRRRR